MHACFCASPTSVFPPPKTKVEERARKWLVGLSHILLGPAQKCQTTQPRVSLSKISLLLAKVELQEVQIPLELAARTVDLKHYIYRHQEKAPMFNMSFCQILRNVDPMIYMKQIGYVDNNDFRYCFYTFYIFFNVWFYSTVHLVLYILLVVFHDHFS